MKTKNENIIGDKKLNLELLLAAEQKPELFSAREELFWDDPHISQKMLEYHLDTEFEAASRKPETIDRTVEWLTGYIGLKEGTRLLDLGCGPGLYCTRFCRRGLDVVGMDYSRNSISYAKKYAEENGMDIKYIYQNYLTMDYSCEFDAILLIYCDFGALTDTDRDVLLKKIYKALKPEGVFIFDVFTKYNRELHSSRNWYASEAGFWRPFPHLVLEQTIHYADENVLLSQYNVIDNDGTVKTYKIWDHYYSRDTVLKLMNDNCFRVQDIWSDLTGEPYHDCAKCLGVAVRKTGSNDMT